jgi:hypothetical protein
VVFSWFLSMVYSFFETRGLGYLEWVVWHSSLLFCVNRKGTEWNGYIEELVILINVIRNHFSSFLLFERTGTDNW